MGRFNAFLMLCLLWVLSFSIGGAESADGRNVERYTITFVGDSLVRYQYLAFVYAIHFKNRNPPNFFITERLFGSWTEFYTVTTSVFQNAVLCDCFRGNVTKYTDYREMRYYDSPDGSLRINYMQKFGDLR
jgi:hypothetical protein